MSKRYGILPSELIKLKAADYSLNAFVASCAIEEENKIIEKHGKNYSRIRKR